MLVLSAHFSFRRSTTKQYLAAQALLLEMEGGFALGKLHRIAGVLPTAPFQIDGQLTLEQYDEDNFGFVKLEFSAAKIIGTSFTAPFSPGDSPSPNIVDVFSIDISSFRVQTVQ